MIKLFRRFLSETVSHDILGTVTKGIKSQTGIAEVPMERRSNWWGVATHAQ